ncbi:glucose-1-phosphate thymidylyltransferase [Candidatus Pacearchaeota archaeon ex4484_26]|nr:MAG: glucose-1-phosphate thymidylyltransferase [Candidatus Pacearchaeota archaeon ex4484_26]
MENFKPAYYFSKKALEEYKEIFLVEYVWEAISNIKGFVEKITKERGKKVVIGENTKVSDKAVIEGPVIIGNNCEIRPGSYIRENVIIGNNCVIRSETKNSLIMDNSNAAHLSYIGDSILGENCNLGAGTILSNLSLSEKPIILKVEDKEINTGMKKFGAILGNNVHTGSNALTNPGTFIGKNSFIYPNAVVRKGFYHSNSIIKLKQQIEVVEKK